jgi:hypothetical protein
MHDAGLVLSVFAAFNGTALTGLVVLSSFASSSYTLGKFF